MTRLEIQLTDTEDEALESLAKDTGKSKQAIIKEALGDVLREAKPDWKAAIMQAAGLWKDREDLPDFDAIRRTLDRDAWGK